MTTPVLVGLYKDRVLFETFLSGEKTSDVLPKIFQDIDKRFKVKALYYAKGPGSFMAIKISYIFLKSYAIAKNIILKATDGFYFNKNKPIKAIGKSYFIKDGDNIIFDTIRQRELSDFKLPKILNPNDFSLNSLPLYILPAV